MDIEEQGKERAGGTGGPRQAQGRHGRRKSLLATAALALTCCAAGLAAFLAWPGIESLFMPGVFSKAGVFPLRDRPVHGLVVSADEKVLAYIAANARGEEYLVLRRGDQVYLGKPYPAIRDLVVSADGSRWAYLALRDPAREAAVDGAAGRLVTGKARGNPGSADCETEGEERDFAGSLRLSHNGRHLAFIAGSGGSWRETAGTGLRYGGGSMMVVKDGKPEPPCDRVTFLSMSADGRHLAWAEARGLAWTELPGGGWDASGGTARVMMDGKEALACDEVSFLALGSEGRRWLCLASSGGAVATLPDGSSLRVGGKEVLYVDGAAGGSYDWCGEPSAAPDLSSWVFVAGRGGSWARSAAGDWQYGGGLWWAISGAAAKEAKGGDATVVTMSEGYDAIHAFQAAAGGRVFAYAAGEGGEWKKKADGTWTYGMGQWKVLGPGSPVSLDYRPGSLCLSAEGDHVAFCYPQQILHYDEDDLGWWFSPSDQPLRLSVDGVVQEGGYADIQDLGMANGFLYVKGRKTALGPSETSIIDLGGSHEEAPTGLSSPIIRSKDGKTRLWIASDHAAYRLVVETITKE